MSEAAQKIEVILVGTDFSEAADAATQWAVDLARLHGASLVFHHSLAPPPGVPSPPEFIPYSPELHEQYHKASEQQLERRVAEASEAGVRATADLRVGSAVPTILQALEDRTADLLVAGTRGLTGLKHVLLGSVAERLVQRAPVPVLTVHPECARLEGEIETVLVPTDFSEDAAPALRAARSIVGAGPARIVLAHAFSIPLEYTNFAGSYLSSDLIEHTRREVQVGLDAAADALKKQGVTVETVAREGYAPRAIVEIAEEKGVDLIAMGTHGRSGVAHALLGSVAERVVQSAGCPVLTARKERK